MILILFLCIFVSKSEHVPKNVHLTNDNFVSLRGPITSQSIAELILNLLDKTADERYIYLNTNGGSVDAGMHLINVIKDLQNNDIKINCIADTAISMGFVIFQSCTRRYVLSYSTLMQHQMSLNEVGGKLQEINSYMSYINKIEDNTNKMQAQRINISQQEFESKINNDWWLTTEESLEYNVADELVSIKCMFPKEKEVKEVLTVFGDINLTYMKCPQISSPIKIELKTITKKERKNIMSIIKENFIRLQKFNPHIFDRYNNILIQE